MVYCIHSTICDFLWEFPGGESGNAKGVLKSSAGADDGNGGEDGLGGGLNGVALNAECWPP